MATGSVLHSPGARLLRARAKSSEPWQFGTSGVSRIRLMYDLQYVRDNLNRRIGMATSLQVQKSLHTHLPRLEY